MEVFAGVLLLGSIGFLTAIHNYFDDKPKTKENNNYLTAGYLF